MKKVFSASDRTSQRLLLRCCAAAILVLAACLKSFSPYRSASLVSSFDIPPMLLVLMVPFELLLGWALLFFPSRKTFLFATTVFAAFATFSLVRALYGFESCGCFGTLVVNPWITFSLDVILAIMLFQASRLEVEALGMAARIPVALFTLLLVGVPLTVLAFRTSPRMMSDLDELGLASSNGVIILEPNEWVGKPLPIQSLLTGTPSQEDMMADEWIVVLYHHDCVKCEALIPLYFTGSTKETGESKILLVEVPPLGDLSWADEFKSRAAYATLPSDRDWFVRTPVEITMQNGEVVNVSNEPKPMNRIAQDRAE